MAAVPLPVTSSPGSAPQEGAGRLINCYCVKTEQGAPTPLKWLRSPGLRTLVTDATHAGLRGAIEHNATVILLMGERARLLAKSGALYTITDLGALSGTDLATVAKNGVPSPGTAIVAVTSAGAFNLSTIGAPSNFADSDLPPPNSVSNVKGYLTFTIAEGRIFCTDLNAVTVNALSYTTAPGPLLRGVSYRDQFFAFGSDFCQVYADRGLTPFPLELQTTIPIGIAGTHAAAGWEPGFTGSLAFVAQDDRVYRLDGYTPQPISTEDVSRDIASTPDKSVLEASVYMANGNAFWCLTRPAHWSWECNLNTGTWNERRSYGANCWRVSRTIKAFSRWIAGDRATGAVFEIDPAAQREGDDPLVLEIVSGTVAAFPDALQAPRLKVNMVAAAGSAAGADPIETDPQLEIAWSRDGGYRFGTPVLRAIGREGEGRRAIAVNRLGLAADKGYRFRLRVSDPRPVILFGADIGNPERRTA
jgi:hypothetical protein